MRGSALVAAARSIWPIVQGQAPVFRGGVDAVRVDVSVMNGVRPVTGLTAANFALTDELARPGYFVAAK